MAQTLAVPLLILLMSLMGISFTSDNIGDSLADVVSSQAGASSELNKLMYEPMMWAYLESTTVTEQFLNDYLASYDVLSANNGLSTKDLLDMGVDITNWITANQGNVTAAQIGTLAYMVQNELGQKVVIEWVFDTAYYDSYGIERYYLTLTSYDSSGNVAGEYDLFGGTRYAVSGKNHLTAYQLAEIFVKNSRFSAETMAYYVVNENGNTFLTLDLSEYMAVEGVLSGSPVYDEEQNPVGYVTIDGKPYALNPDGSLTIDGTTYYPNADGTIDVGENTYTPTVDFRAYNDTALLDLIRQLILTLTGTQSEDGTKDYTGILGVIVGCLRGMNTSLSNLLANVIAIPQKIIDFFTVDQKTVTALIDSNMITLKKKIGYNTMIENVNTVTTAFFGKRSFNSDGKVIVAPVFSNGEAVVSGYPHLYFTLFGKKYDLFSDITLFDGAIAFFKIITAVFLNVGAAVSIFRSVPSILISCGEIIGIRSPATVTNTFSSFGIFAAPKDKKGG